MISILDEFLLFFSLLDSLIHSNDAQSSVGQFYALLPLSVISLQVLEESIKKSKFVVGLQFMLNQKNYMFSLCTFKATVLYQISVLEF